MCIRDRLMSLLLSQLRPLLSCFPFKEGKRKARYGVDCFPAGKYGKQKSKNHLF